MRNPSDIVKPGATYRDWWGAYSIRCEVVRWQSGSSWEVKIRDGEFFMTIVVPIARIYACMCGLERGEPLIAAASHGQTPWEGWLHNLPPPGPDLQVP